jgi:CRISPR-associated protein Csc2
VQRLVKEEPVRISKQIFGAELDSLVAEVTAIYQDEASLLPIITNLAEQAKNYAESYGAKSDSKKKKK